MSNVILVIYVQLLPMLDELEYYKYTYGPYFKDVEFYVDGTWCDPGARNDTADLPCFGKPLDRQASSDREHMHVTSCNVCHSPCSAASVSGSSMLTSRHRGACQCDRRSSPECIHARCAMSGSVRLQEVANTLSCLLEHTPGLVCHGKPVSRSQDYHHLPPPITLQFVHTLTGLFCHPRCTSSTSKVADG